MKKSILFTALLFATAATLTTSDAFALTPTDGTYLQGSISLGAGRTSRTIDSGSITTTTTDKFSLDGGLNIGGGIPITRKLTLHVNGYWTGRYSKINDSTSEFFNQINLLAGLDFFFYGGFFVGGGVGFAYSKNSITTEYGGGSQSISFSEPGWGMRFSLGYEVRLSRKFNLGIAGYYMHNFFYPNNETDSYLSLGGQVYIRWH